MFHIVVCAKAVPDPQQACNVKIDPQTKTLMRCDVPMVLNPLDKNAMEAALELKGRFDGRITILSMGPPDAAEIVKECLALGGDDGILLSDPAFGGADAYATAYTLAKAVEKLNPVDLILCGMASSDGATEWVGPEMAVFLNRPVVTMVQEIEEGIDSALVPRSPEDAVEPADFLLCGAVVVLQAVRDQCRIRSSVRYAVLESKVIPHRVDHRRAGVRYHYPRK